VPSFLIHIPEPVDHQLPPETVDKRCPWRSTKPYRLRRGSRGGRPPAFDRETYKQRNTVERCINRLKQWRGIATRYEKTATIYLAGLYVAGIFIWSAR
jgi:transposase